MPNSHDIATCMLAGVKGRGARGWSFANPVQCVMSPLPLRQTGKNGWLSGTKSC